MKMLHRMVAGMVAIAMMVAMSTEAGAQVLKHVRDDALVVIKLNNAQAVNGKLAAMAQKMGLANLHPAAADPLSLLRQQLNLKEGLNLKGEVAVVIFRPVIGESEPRAMALIPVSDYKAFLTNYPDAAQDGDVDTFSIMPGGEAVFADQWGEYAAITPWKDLLLEMPQGLSVTGVIGKQLQEKDLTVYVNMRAVREMVLPQVRQIRTMMQNMPVGNNAAPGMPGAFQRAMAVQVLQGVDSLLTQTQAAAISLNLVPAGVSATASLEFEPTSAWGASVAQVENTDAALLTGLPKADYLAFGGAALGGSRLWELFKGIYEAPTKAVELEEADAKALQEVMTAYEKIMTSMKGMTFGLVAPPAGSGATGLVRMVALVDGDANTMLEANKRVFAKQNAFLKATGNPGLSMDTTIQPAAKTIDGVKLDQYATQVTVDANAPMDQATARIFDVLYGKEIRGTIGAINSNTLISSIGVDDSVLRSTIATVKQGQAPLGGDSAIQAVSRELPQKRVGVAYIALGNIVTTALDIASQMGAAPPMKLPADLPPMGVSVATEGSAVRIDAHVPSSLIETMVSTGLQMAIQHRAQPRPQGGL